MTDNRDESAADNSAQEPINNRLRILLLVIAVVVGLGVAAVPVVISLTGDHDASVSSVGATGSGATGTASASTSGTGGLVDDVDARYSIGADQRISCPGGIADSASAGGGNAGSGAATELSTVTLPCLTDGGGRKEMSLAAALSGKPTLINVWAWWCQPCRAELPILQAAAEKHPEWNIVGVHANGQGQAGADLLSDLDVRLASFQDSSGAFIAAAELPQVIPVSVIYRADGSRVSFHPGEITSVAQLEKLMTEA